MTNDPNRTPNEPRNQNTGALWAIGIICAIAGALVAYWLFPRREVAYQTEPVSVTDTDSDYEATQPLGEPQTPATLEPDAGLDEGDTIVVYEVTPTSTLTQRQMAERATVGAGRPEISDLTVLFGPSASEFLGSSVEIRSAPVQGTAGPNSFWIGPSFSQKMLVVFDEGVTMPTVNQADRVHVVGTLTTLPSEADMMNRWQLNEQNIKELTRTNVYLQAREVMIDQR